MRRPTYEEMLDVVKDVHARTDTLMHFAASVAERLGVEGEAYDVHMIGTAAEYLHDRCGLLLGWADVKGGEALNAPSSEQTVRENLSRQAAYEVEALGKALIREAALDNEELSMVARGIGARLASLIPALLAFDGNYQTHPTLDAHNSLYLGAVDLVRGDAA